MWSAVEQPIVELMTLPSALNQHMVVPLMTTPPPALGAKNALLSALEKVKEAAAVVSML